MNDLVPVTIPVFAKVGPVHLRLAPYEEFPLEGALPWAWLALCRVTFHFGKRVTTKRLTQKYAWSGATGWPCSQRPSPAEVDAGREAVLSNMRTLIREHGVNVQSLLVTEVPS